MSLPRDNQYPAATEALQLLRTGELDVVGRLAVASNATLYCDVRAPETGTVAAHCVYKPVAGERPLWDFPQGSLAGREVAAYAVSEALGWRVVPPTVYRSGPYGPGMCQWWIDGDPEVDLVELSRDTQSPGLRRMAVFDAVINNADRKIGHLLPVPCGHLYGCDHGLSFAVPDKLRTVLWQWQGAQLPPDVLDDLRRLEAQLRDSGSPLARCLAEYLSPAERRATLHRVMTLRIQGVHPSPQPDWPSIPWPPV
ncbi:SCO1664 family protein [Lipingzhangella sp. LS1_29]|uniref:SCO1664 family protein n=1 Tax=Lipingzhangella rawalii TaxID=2055835 RepID=A0ABU2H2S8_9ACTN|nr:SCO1664 family protein [Lipingzhangella rawalii]MDS1268924.1 SCO1664 family protein [Lipingzhangella rawalii]